MEEGKRKTKTKCFLRLIAKFCTVIWIRLWYSWIHLIARCRVFLGQLAVVKHETRHYVTTNNARTLKFTSVYGGNVEEETLMTFIWNTSCLLKQCSYDLSCALNEAKYTVARRVVRNAFGSCVQWGCADWRPNGMLWKVHTPRDHRHLSHFSSVHSNVGPICLRPFYFTFVLQYFCSIHFMSTPSPTGCNCYCTTVNSETVTL